MRIARVLENDRPVFVRILGGQGEILAGEDLPHLAPTGRFLDLAGRALLAPVMPSKVVAVGLNYRDHALEMHEELPDDPKIFLKPATSVIGPGEPIVCPPMSSRVDYEAELAVIIGRRAAKISPEEAPAHIFGYTCLNDVTARDLQKKDGQWTRAKGFDTFCPLGPAIETEIDPGRLKVEARVNGQIRQSSNTANLIFPVPVLVSFISQVMTLLPGDVIATGTPPGVGPIRPGEVVEIELEGIGVLSNPVVSGLA